MIIQQELIDKVLSGQCVAFIGAGVSMEAQAPSASQLAQELNEQFLQKKYDNENLNKIASYIEKKLGLGRAIVVNYIINKLSQLEPSNGHLLIPRINWASLYTTNFDTLIEKAYSISGINYRPIIYNSDLSISYEEKENLQLIYKPHGCISRPDSLILTEDDYYDSTKNRIGIFRQLENHKYKNTFLFMGYSFSDFDLSRIWFDVRKETGDFAQWSYALWPNCTEEQKSLWQSRNVILIDAMFGDFMSELMRHKRIDNKHITGDKLNSSSELIKALLICLEMKDSFYKEHGILTAEIASLIAKELSFENEHSDTVKLASLVHNIGMIKTPENILYKSGLLSLSEYELIKQHTIIGENVVSEFSGLKHLSGIIRSHHEMFNGKGYPDGLCNDEIPIESRIITLADAFISMSMDRPYRKGLTTEEVIKVINSLSGTEFDPKIVNAFNAVYNDGLLSDILNKLQYR